MLLFQMLKLKLYQLLQIILKMLEVIVPEQECYNSKTNEFEVIKSQSIKLEHSLISISKWESKWKKPFLTKNNKTPQEIRHYIECMCIGSVSDKDVFSRLSSENIEQINDYIADSMTATWFNDARSNRSRDVVTSEVIYAQMIGFGIPVEFEKWHINRLLTLIKVCDIMFNKNSKDKMSKKDIYRSNRELNAARRAKMNSTG